MGAGVALVAGLLASCASWETARRSDQFTLFTRAEARVDLDLFERSLDIAFTAVETELGSFRRRVNVHVMPEPAENDPQPQQAGSTPQVEGIEQVPGMGPARVRAWHVRGGATPFSPTGVFLATTDVGTAVHELVHARLAELDDSVPLWFEEGVGTLLGDGAEFGGRWVVDGLACWPVRELRQQELSDSELERLLALTARDRYDARENLLVHFVGWALVFDLRREWPNEDWREWLAAFRRGAKQEGLIAHARGRLARAISEESIATWLERLGHADPAVRFASAKGLWKLRSPACLDRVLVALASESDRQTRVCLALNALLSSSEMRIGRTRWRRLAEHAFPVLRESDLEDPLEVQALTDLYEVMRWSPRRTRSTAECLEDLDRFWDE
jgi:hypothetical protein